MQVTQEPATHARAVPPAPTKSAWPQTATTSQTYPRPPAPALHPHTSFLWAFAGNPAGVRHGKPALAGSLCLVAGRPPPPLFPVPQWIEDLPVICRNPRQAASRRQHLSRELIWTDTGSATTCTRSHKCDPCLGTEPVLPTQVPRRSSTQPLSHWAPGRPGEGHAG